MKSKWLATGMGYIYSLGDPMDENLITIEVSQLRSRGGSPLALLSTSSLIKEAQRIPGSNNRVMNGEVWLLSETSRANYAHALAARIPSPTGAAAIDFVRVLEEVAQRVIDAENSPVEVTILDPAHKVKPTPWLMDGIIPANKPTILYGAGGVGKSIVAATLAVAIQTGTNWLGVKTRQTEVLYLDWETDEGDIASRVSAAAKGLNPTDPVEIRYASLVRPIEDRVAQLARYVAEQKVGLVIIDSVGMAMSTARDGSDASETAIRFFRALRSLSTAVLAIDHVSGDDMRRARGGAAKPYGSVYKWNSARNAFELREERDPDVNGAHLVLKHRKSNLGPRQPDRFLTMIWDNGVVTFTTERAKPTMVVALDERIADLLSVAPATPHALADLLSTDDHEVSELEVRLVLKGMVGTGVVTVTADGSARLITAKAEPDGLLPPD